MAKSFDRQKVLIDIKRKLKEGYTSSEIREFIQNNYEISKQNIVFLTREANELIKREQDFNLRDVMIQHSALYEKIWTKNFRNPFSKKLDNPDEDLEDQDVRKTLFKIANHYEIAAEALQRKEKMLGITHNRMDVQLKNELSEQEQKEEPEFDNSKFDPNKLTLAENLELLALLKKAKGESEVEPVKIVTTVTIAQNNKVDELKYEEVVSKFDIETVDYEIVEDIPAQVKVDKINQSLIAQEAKLLDDKIAADKKALKKEQFEKNKQKLLAKYRKLK